MLSKITHVITRWLTGKSKKTEKNEPTRNTVLLWDALRELNSRLIASPGSVFVHVKAVHDHLELRGKVSRSYIASVTPLLCHHDEFMALHEWQDLSFLYKFGKNRNAWKLSLALPTLIADGKVELATELVIELTRKSSEGWLNTECIRFALEQVLQIESTNHINVKASVQFQRAFLNLLDAFKGDWFSRLHDLELIKATVVLLTALVRYDHTHRDKVATAAIRHYGLCPTFWQYYEAQVADPALAQANAQWQTIHRALNVGNPLSSMCLQELITSLAWFHERHNPDALMFMRDIVANHVKDRRQESGLAGQKMVDWLTQAEPVDAKRLEANAVWPTYQPATFGPNCNQLDLLSTPEQASNLMQHDLLVVSVVRNEMTMLPYFFEHYRKLGITCFVFVDNGSTDGTEEYLRNQTDVVLYATETEYKHANYGVAWQQAVLGNHCLGKWVVLADADEFLVYPGYEYRPFAEFLAEVEKQKADAVLTFMVDMYPFGSLAEADFTKASPFQAAPWHDAKPLIEWRLGSGQYSNATNYLSGLRQRLAKPSPPNAFTSQKIALVRYQPWLRFSEGLHNAANIKTAKDIAAFAHFKYHAAFEQKVREEIRRGQHYNNAEEYKRYVELLNDASEGFRNNDSVKFTDGKNLLATILGSE